MKYRYLKLEEENKTTELITTAEGTGDIIKGDIVVHEDKIYKIKYMDAIYKYLAETKSIDLVIEVYVEELNDIEDKECTSI